MTDQSDDWKSIAVSLPARYWVTVFVLIEKFVEDSIRPKIEKLQKSGTSLEQVFDEVKAALMGPIFARGAIVDALCEAGVVKPEVKARVGTDKLMEMAKRHYDRRRKSNGHK